MKKNNFYLLQLLVILCFGFSFAACSDDDDDNGGNTSSTLTINNEAIEITDLEAEYDGGTFFFWVNDVATTDKRVYIQAEFSTKESVSAGTDITSKFEILFQRNGGREWFVGEGKNSGSSMLGEGYNSYRGGNIVIKDIDSNKKTITIEFKEVQYFSNLKNTITINGTLKLNYKVI